MRDERGILTTYTYDDAGKRNGQQISVPDDPELHAILAAKEKVLLQRLQDAGDNERMKDDVLHDMIGFYTAQSLEFDKAANLQFALTNPADIYSLKLILALNATKSNKEKNEKLEELIQMFPDKKKYGEFHPQIDHKNIQGAVEFARPSKLTCPPGCAPLSR